MGYPSFTGKGLFQKASWIASLHEGIQSPFLGFELAAERGKWFEVSYFYHLSPIMLNTRHNMGETTHFLFGNSS
jgi:hypothetical protein